MIRKLVFVVIAVMATASLCFGQAAAPAQRSITLDQLNKLGENGARYTAAAPLQLEQLSVFGNQPVYMSEEQFASMPLMTAKDIGFTGAGWNELCGQGAALVFPNPDLKFRVDVANGWYWMDQCECNGKEFKNRYKPLTPPAQPPRITHTPPQAPPPVTTTPVTPPVQIVYVPVTQTVTVPASTTTVVGGGCCPPVAAAPVPCCDSPTKYEQIQRIQLNVPHVGFCDTRHGWKQPFQGLVEPFVCEPFQTLAIVGTSVLVSRLVDNWLDGPDGSKFVPGTPGSPVVTPTGQPGTFSPAMTAIQPITITLGK